MLKSPTISPDDLVCANKQIQANLSAEESYLWSRVGDGIKVKDLLVLCPWAKDQSFSLLNSLVEKSCVQIKHAIAANQAASHPTHKPQENKSPQKLSRKICDQLEMDKMDPQTRDMDLNFRKDILLRLEKCENENPFEILDVKRSASDHEVKQSYLQLSRKFHPDRFFRKKMGPYNKKLAQLFTSIQKAYELIKNPHDREALLRKMKNEEKSSSETPKAPSPQDLKRKLDPKLQQIGKAEQYYQMGLEAERNGNYIEAANQYILASQLNPEKKIYEKSIANIKPFVDRERGQELLKNAENAFEVGLAEDALVYAEQALKLQAEVPKASYFLGKAIVDLALMDRLQDAFELLRRAKVGLPKDPLPCVELGRLYQARNEDDKAIQEYQEALKRDSGCTRAKKLLAKLKA